MSWTLSDIQTKIRDVTGTPSQDQITDADLTNKINQYMVFTMPAELKVQIATNFLDFKTTPGVDVYVFPGTYLTDSPGAYADGFPLVFYQDPDIFYQDWPQQYAVNNVATGDGVTTNFTGGLQSPPIIIGSMFITDGVQVLQDTGTQVAEETIDTGNGGTTYNGTLSFPPIVTGTLSITSGNETFIDNGDGTLSSNLAGTGTINYTTGVWAVTFGVAVVSGVDIIATYTLNTSNVGTLTGDGFGTINYLTGAYDVTFATAPASTDTIYAKYIGYSGNRPQGVLFFNNQFTMRPIPDQVYQIRMQGFVNPTPLVKPSDTCTQAEWGPLVAYGTALEIFADRGDLDSYNKTFPMFKRYENVALSRTIQQYTVEQSVPRF